MKKLIADRSNYGSKRSTNNIHYIVIHYTGNDGDKAINNAKYFQTPNRKASAHYFVDDNEIIQSVDDDHIAWSVGGSKYSDYAKTGGGKLYSKVTNANSLNIEMCDMVKNEKIQATDKTIENTIGLMRQKMDQYGIDIDHIVRHFDVTGKLCPAYLVDDKKWGEFKNKLKEKEKFLKPSKRWIKNVQMVIGTSSDGIARKETLSKTKTLQFGSRGVIVHYVKQRLRALGYPCSMGQVFDDSTVQAVNALQKDMGVKPAGKIIKEQGTWKVLLGLRTK